MLSLLNRRRDFRALEQAQEVAEECALASEPTTVNSDAKRRYETKVSNGHENDGALFRR